MKFLLIAIHPALANPIVEAFEKFLRTVSPAEMTGLIILQSSGHIRILE